MAEAAFQKMLEEIQAKSSEYNRQLVQVRTQIQLKERERKVSEIQIRELEAAGTKTNTFVSVGKMFLQMPQPTIVNQLQLKVASLADDVAVLTKKQAYLVKSVADCQSALNEAIKQMQSA
ncbi:hypothetical protein AMAG_17366 [Allomyces macrogynus ATCC 38327]|uniref:Prefoldin, alpha subunit n=1 Tax=Allomyces macrogynus (strain ATCC 38327) TaxID=578462 RepID=A0A0L0TE66_ALLM3|nr:hypothetical protein AMAG_17366 [Allomyces macrogynus ATCC 38327]|eukprot:KNE73168.1 hypothetical protein AMAG_17366 [Allomyces macrogynus ATCC 38327]